MGKTTNIAWCDATFNPWHGCMKVSPGCTNCYMHTFLKRIGKAEFNGPSGTTSRRLFGPKHWAEPLAWNREASRLSEHRRVFCASMADVFEDHPQLNAPRADLWGLIRATPNLDWLLLTKRPENIAAMLPDGYWPNVWLGTSTETQEYLEQRVPLLLHNRDRAPVLFLSAEPLLGPLDLRYALEDFEGFTVDWVITGGESGAHHRPLDVQWVREIDRQCRAAGVAHFFKQHGGRSHAEGGCLLDGAEVKEFPRPRLGIAA